MGRLKSLPTEEEAMFLSVYYENSRGCDARSILKMEVETCSNAISALCHWHGKSPCFSTSHILTVVSVDKGALIFNITDGEVFHE